MDKRQHSAARVTAVLGVWCGVGGLLLATYFALYGGSLLTNTLYLITAGVIVLSIGLTLSALKSHRYRLAVIGSLPCLALALYLAGVIVYVIAQLG